jgi:hypothetical protein
MIRFSNAFVNPLWIRSLLLILLWTVSFIGLFGFAPSRGSIPSTSHQTVSQSPSISSGQAGPFRYTRFDPSSPSKALYAFEMKSAESSPGTFGLFRTGGYRTLSLDRVRISLNLQESEPGAAPIPAKGVLERPKSKAKPKKANLKRPVCPWQIFQEDLAAFERRAIPRVPGGITLQVDCGLPDLSHILGIEIRQFECTIHQGTEPLHIRSQSASWSAGHPEELILRGHVVVSNGQTLLEGNALRWDLQTNRFRTDKPCYVTNPVGNYRGNNLEFDSTLNTL